MINGSVCVVGQLDSLVRSKCLRIEARVVRVCEREDGEVRAAVLIDVFLPIDAWSGWQFPRMKSLAASFFKHVSCCWELRNSLLAFDWNSKEYNNVDDESVWSYSDCHVIGCKWNCNSSGSKNQKLFDLHEIFKSLPSAIKEESLYSTRIKPEEGVTSPGICDVADDVLSNILSLLGPEDLVRVAATCRHLRYLAVPIMPFLKLRLFPHQQAAVEWMLKRERNAEVLKHPLYMDFHTEDGFSIYINAISGKICTGMAPNTTDFRGGMFCDEPGLGKTVTALSLILKTRGTLADPPPGVDVVWCVHDLEKKCGYYELKDDNFTTPRKRFTGQNIRMDKVFHNGSSLESSSVGNTFSMEHARYLSGSPEISAKSASPSTGNAGSSSYSVPVTCLVRNSRAVSGIKRNLLTAYGKSEKKQRTSFSKFSNSSKESKNNAANSEVSETWVQCEACRKWRKLSNRSNLDTTAPWFCSMNTDIWHQNCADLEESWDCKRRITYLPGFYTKGTPDGKEQNISFFTSVLREHFSLFNSETEKALTWLANLSHIKIQQMEKDGLTRPVVDARMDPDSNPYYHKIFQAFGLVRRVESGTSRWYYPSNLEDLAFDTMALGIALTKPLNLFRLYLSRATLIVVPANLVDHWRTQISKHVSAGQLSVYVWTDHKKPCAHNLAWDYDIVITTFSRLSLEWGPQKRSVLRQVHWLRIMLDEGHTLGSSLSMSNKLHMAISLPASSRWILTGTPTPNTPISQLAQLQPMLKFLHEETYGTHQEYWDAGILKPFEANMEEGRSRLLDLLSRTMISARKIDLKNIPPCVKKITFLDFSEEHARSYNELVLTVRRNILMADWNDPSHVESLLNPKQWKFRSNTIRNVRLSCCVAGHIKVTDAGEDIQETLDILVQQGLDPVSEEYQFIRSALLNGCSCFRCKGWCRLPVITPCRHLLCLDCVALDSEKCTLPGCGNHYEMQSPEILTRPENPTPKWPVPKDLIELQPSYKQDDWDADWQSTSSSKVAYLVQCLKVLQEINRKISNDSAQLCSGSVFANSQTRDFSLVAHNEAAYNWNAKSYDILTEKVIVFSQFLEHIHVIEQQLTIADIGYAGMYSPMQSGNKMKSLLTFQQDPNCMVLLMDGSAALGLDLSFVTHVFLMEPIWDRSMEEQVISRAHRMGATRPINVETLAMRGTIEEQMLEFLQDVDACRRALKQEAKKGEYEGTRVHRVLHDFAESNYLARLNFVHTGV